MRIGINARCLSGSNLRGWSRYTANLIRELSFLSHQLFLFSDRPVNKSWLAGADFDSIEIVEEEASSYIIWEQIHLARLGEEKQIDLLFCPTHFGLPKKGSFKKILTLHDAIEAAYYDARYSLRTLLHPRRLYARLLNKMSRDAADIVVTVSEFSKKDIIQYYGVAAEKIQVIPGAADPAFELANVKERGVLQTQFAIENKYFFYVGGFEDRKNVNVLLEAFSHLKSSDFQLVLAGGGGEKIFAEFQPLFKEGRVLRLGYVADEWLPSLYAHAHAFVYPSLYEGFGLQIVEALKMGAPVLASNQTSLPEVLQNTRATFDPSSVEDLKSLLEKCMVDNDFINDLRQHSKSRQAFFSWQKSAQQLADIF